jgi:hypothetical protein
MRELLEIKTRLVPAELRAAARARACITTSSRAGFTDADGRKLATCDALAVDLATIYCDLVRCFRDYSVHPLRIDVGRNFLRLKPQAPAHAVGRKLPVADQPPAWSENAGSYG